MHELINHAPERHNGLVGSASTFNGISSMFPFEAAGLAASQVHRRGVVRGNDYHETFPIIMQLLTFDSSASSIHDKPEMRAFA
jgi:hypothetical protein